MNLFSCVWLQAKYQDGRDEARTDMLVVAQYAPRNHHLSVSTSTTNARVGEYIIFHVRADFYIEEFSYVVSFFHVSFIKSMYFLECIFFHFYLKWVLTLV